MLTNQEQEDLATRIGQVVADRLLNRQRLTDRVATAARLGVSVPTLDRLRSSGRVTPIVIGSRVMYDVEAVIADLAGGADDA